MKQTLQLRTSQHLALTPQLQQSIRLLQLSTLELEQEVELMLATNPFLEMEEPEGDGAAHADQSSVAAAPANFDDTPESAQPSQQDFDNGVEEFTGNDWQLDASAGGGQFGDEDPISSAGESISLREHLRAQAADLRLSGQERALLWWLIDGVDEDGFLDLDPDEPGAWGDELLRAIILQSQEDGDPMDDCLESIWVPRMKCALKWLQAMDPPGVGARDLAECLQLQLRQRPPSPAQSLALAICQQPLDWLAKQDIKRLSKATGASESALLLAIPLIAQLSPRPGAPFARTEGGAIIPDVLVKAKGSAWDVQLNPDVIPKIALHKGYVQAMQGLKGTGHQAAQSSLQEARFFIKNIRQRYDTILRVSKAIVERQSRFLVHGPLAMRPLVLREIAEAVDLHESTISRVTTAKYMATPMGVFELKHFFTSSLQTESGGSASSTAVRALIEQFIAAENARHPLSDADISKMLEEQGIQVARRTVAKYREGLRIPVAQLRRTR